MLARSAEQDGLTPAPDPGGNELSPCLCAACMTSHNSMPKDKVGPSCRIVILSMIFTLATCKMSAALCMNA